MFDHLHWRVRLPTLYEAERTHVECRSRLMIAIIGQDRQEWYWKHCVVKFIYALRVKKISYLFWNIWLARLKKKMPLRKMTFADECEYKKFTESFINYFELMWIYDPFRYY